MRSLSFARSVAFFGALAVSVAVPNALVVSLTAKPAGAANPTVISIEFDDGTASQYQARPWLAARGLPATFYINSGTRPPSFNTMSWTQLHDLANDGNEIGGHTVDHEDLTQISATEARAEVCDDRNALVAQGFNVRSFAYPYGHSNQSIEDIVQSCGYSSARGVSGINSTIIDPDFCDGCPYAETIPPQDPYDTRTPENTQSTFTEAQIEGFVTQAEQHGGGWVQLVFHEICPDNNPNCDQYGITPTKLRNVLDFIAGRVAQGAIVKTVGDVISGGPVQPPPTGPNLVKNPSLETPASATAVPDCWQQGAAGTNTATWSHTSDAHTGSFAEKVTISAYTSGDRKIVQRQDSGACAPAITASHRYQLSEWYKGSAAAFVIFTRNAAGTWIFCQQTAAFPASFTWTQATFTWTQPTTSANGCGSSSGYVPTAISFGLALSRAGSLTVDDASLVDVGV
jgi:peptidoglycan/xylan/chitin deacetylase (PgdA/CDA1 family)